MALARKLVTIAWQMLKHNEPYRYAKPLLMATKFAKLRRLYREKDMPTAPAARRKVPEGLAAVYSALELPAVLIPEELPAGECQMLLDKEVLQFVEELYRPVVPQKTSKRNP